ncbi:hypothetical protein T492DRAFT_1056318 [Pavlovales sp. CCMP2436]|nr:hypothetical protein T492DRAFT_1056318 [Pavlovales sp. CCMP2436]
MFEQGQPLFEHSGSMVAAPPQLPPPLAQAPPPSTEAQVPDGHTMMLITVPDGMQPGAQMLVQTPSGALFVVTVPLQCGPKEQFQIAVPNSAASIGPQSLVPLGEDAGGKKGRKKKAAARARLEEG